MRDDRGRTLAMIVQQRGQMLIDSIKREATKEIAMIAKQEVNDISNWSISPNVLITDPDLFVAPLYDEYATGRSLSVKDAIQKDTPRIMINEFSGEVSIGNIEELLKLSPRILYFEFGTLSQSEVGRTMNLSKYSISDFDIWNNPYLKGSALSQSDKVSSWGYLAKDGGGRFGQGYMVPANSKVPKFSGIMPVRMYRGSMIAIERRISESFKDIVYKAKGEMGL